MRCDQVGLVRIQRVAAGDRFALQRAAQPSQIPHEEVVAVFVVEFEPGESRRVAAVADAELQPAAADQVEHDGVLGDADRQFQRQGDDAGAEPDA